MNSGFITARSNGAKTSFEYNPDRSRRDPQSLTAVE